MRKTKNLIGKHFGFLEVLELDKEKTEETHKTYWKCQCDCGNIVSVWSSNLLSGHTKSCGCYQKSHKRIDEMGKRYGKLTVIGFDEKTYKWICKCDCGNIIKERGSSLRLNQVKSCGCGINKSIQEIPGTRYGKLTVMYLNKEKSEKANEWYWHCKCDCGTEIDVKGSNLRHGNTQSCGCLRSLGEETIAKYLIENNIKYKKEYTFEDLTYKKTLRFDFGILNNNNKLKFLIEYQGYQHFKDTDWGKTQREITDFIKEEYCKKNNIILYYITYRDNIEEKLDKIFQETI